MISEASVPTTPSAPKRSMVLALSLVLGLMAGTGIAALQEFHERFFRSADDVRNELGLKFLGYLPIIGNSALERLRERKQHRVDEGDAGPAFRSIMRVAVDAPGSHFAETLRNARIAADVMLQALPSKVIGVTSVLPDEGKSTVAANFAGLLAANGSKTLLIDADLRNPGLSRMLATPPENGIVEALVGEVPWPAAVRVDRKTRLAILPTRERGQFAHSFELLTSLNMRRIVEAARGEIRRYRGRSAAIGTGCRRQGLRRDGPLASFWSPMGPDPAQPGPFTASGRAASRRQGARGALLQAPI